MAVAPSFSIIRAWRHSCVAWSVAPRAVGVTASITRQARTMMLQTALPVQSSLPHAVQCRKFHFACRSSLAGRATFPARTLGGRANQNACSCYREPTVGEGVVTCLELYRAMRQLSFGPMLLELQSRPREAKPDQREAPRSPRIALISVRAPPPASWPSARRQKPYREKSDNPAARV